MPSDWRDYKSGDFVGVEGGVLARIAEVIFEPQTSLYHFLVIRSRLIEENDYEIIEMLGKGCSIGRLSWYLDRPFVVYRLNDPDVDLLGKKAAKYASKFGRVKYDYMLFVRLPFAIIRCFLRQLLREHTLRRIRPDELNIPWDSIFVCTELPKAIWLEVGKQILQPKDAGMPAAYVKANLLGKTNIVGYHFPKQKQRTQVLKFLKIADALQR